MIQFLLLTFLVLPIQTQPSSLKQWLANHQWKNRIILLYAPSASAAELKRQREIFAADPTGIKERDLIVREVLADNLSEADQTYLKGKLNVSESTFQVLLIGKDGGVKIRQRTPLATKQLYGTIDGMYMRKQEMKKSSR
jgi:hypothetical protein